jgi:hypothetical protein
VRFSQRPITEHDPDRRRSRQFSPVLVAFVDALALAIVVGALWALDLYAFDGRHSQAAWQEANTKVKNLATKCSIGL